MYLFNYFTQTGILTTIYRIAIQQKGTFHLTVVNFLDFISLLVVFLSALYFLRLQLSFPFLSFPFLSFPCHYHTLFFISHHRHLLILPRFTLIFRPNSRSRLRPHLCPLLCTHLLPCSTLMLALFFVLFFSPAALLCSLSSLTLFSPTFPIQPYPRSHLSPSSTVATSSLKTKKGLHEWKPFLFRV